MSAPLAIELERELGIDPRAFDSVHAVMRWYGQSRARKEGVVNLWSRGEPCSAEVRARAKMTYARVVACLAPQHHADYDEEPLSVNAIDAARAGRRPLETAEQEAERRVQEFAAWCTVTGEGKETGQAFLSERLRFNSAEGCSAYMGYTARVLRRRFVAAGLLVEGD
jgi:hypothetical protein